jgi:hypothetical protein
MEHFGDLISPPPREPQAPPRGSPRLTPQLIFGLIVIGAGVLFTLENLHVIDDAGRFLRFWPAAVIAIGLVQIWGARDRPGSASSGVIITAVGLWLLLEQTDLVNIRFADLWPLLLVCVGGYLVWQGLAGAHERTVDTTSTVSALAILSGVSRRTNSQAFRGGDLTAFMGGCEIDLRRAAIHGEATIDVFALWGGIEIRVPDTWTVVSRVTPLMGAFEDKTRPSGPAGVHRLVLRGFVLMAGVEVKN